MVKDPEFLRQKYVFIILLMKQKLHQQNSKTFLGGSAQFNSHPGPRTRHFLPALAGVEELT